MGDLKLAIRSLFKQPIFALTAVATLALGIGATTAIFSVVNAVLLKPLPYRDADRVMIVWGDLRNRNVTDWPFSNPDFADVRAQSTSFEGLAALGTNRMTVRNEQGDSEVVRMANATTNIFEVLGLGLARGRNFTDADGTPPPPEPPPAAAGAAAGANAPPAAPRTPPPPLKVILSHEYWQRRFGADEGIVGSTSRLGPVTIEIIGVLQPGAELLFPPGSNVEQRPDLWAPMRVDFTQGNRNNVGARVVGRLKSDVSRRQAQADVDGIAAELRRRFAIKETAGLFFRVEPIGEDLVADVKDGILVLMGAVVFVLLIACANVANLLLVRSAAREREMAVRAALGAGQWRMVRQLLVESLVLAGIAAIGGALLAQIGVGLLLALRPANLPRIDTIALDPVVLGFAALASVISAVTFGLLPAIRSARPDLMEVLRRAGRTASLGSGTRLRSAVVVAEVVLSFVLLIGSGLMLRSFIALYQVNPGFDPSMVVTFRLAGLNLQGPDAAQAFVRDASAQLRAVPGVTAVTLASSLPLDGTTSNARYGNERAAADPNLFQQADVRFVMPGYVQALRTRVVEGREFTDADNHSNNLLVVIDSIVARRAFPGESAVGKRLLSRIRTDEPEVFEVIGVVEHQRHGSLAEEGREGIFFPSAIANYTPGGRWAIRLSGDPVVSVPALRAEIARLPRAPLVAELEPMSAFVNRATARTRFALVLIGVFAAIAVLLATVGLYSVLSTVVRQRTAEIGVRMAFGAGGGHIFRMMVGLGLKLGVIGLVVGTVTALLLTGALRSQLVGVRPTDPLTFVSVAVLFMAIAALAAGIPAWRASRLDPTTALRQD
jgi:putative ABC transport system permease protein